MPLPTFFSWWGMPYLPLWLGAEAHPSWRCPQRRLLLARCQKLRAEAASLKHQAAALNTPATFSKCAKLERQALAREKEVERLEEQLGARAGAMRLARVVRALKVRCSPPSPHTSTRHPSAERSRRHLWRPENADLPLFDTLHQALLWFGVTVWFWNRPLLYLPPGLLAPLGSLLASPHLKLWRGVGAVTALPWLSICNSACSGAIRRLVS